MALSNSVNWYVRAGGAQTNGGGYDSTVSGAGTNYSDQDSPQLSITDLTSTASTTVTSVLSTFTSAMVGNILRLASGTGTTAGYYMITGYTSASQITLDRASGTYTIGVAKIGGAHASLINYSNSGSATAPTLTSPLLPGHTVNVRGAGTNDPSTADYTQSGFYVMPNGDTTNGPITWIGYNGRPRFNCDALMIYNSNFQYFSNFKFVAQNNSNGTLGIIGQNAANNMQAINCYFDQNGNDIVGCTAFRIISCRFTNSGSATAGTNTNSAIVPSNYNGQIQGNYVNGWKGDGLYFEGNIASAINNIIVNCGVNGIELTNGTTSFGLSVIGNTVYGNTGDGIKVASVIALSDATIINNITAKNGGYGINVATTGTALNNKLINGAINYNNYGTGATANTSGAVNNFTMGASDVQLDPQFVSTSGANYAVGTNMQGIGFPATFETTASVSSVTLGAVQPAAGGGGGASMLVNPGMSGGMRG